MWPMLMNVALPAVMGIVTVLYVMHQAAMENRGTHGPPPGPSRPGSGFGSSAGSTSRPSPRTGSNHSSRPAAGNTEIPRRPNSSFTSRPHTGPCLTCHEESNMAQLHSCQCRCLCEDCVNMLISSMSNCPRCGRRIRRFGNSY